MLELLVYLIAWGVIPRLMLFLHLLLIAAILWS